MKNILLVLLFTAQYVQMQAAGTEGEEKSPVKETIDYRALYISLYKNIAIEEMQRTGIPASIKLAQGILESNSGRSELAEKANNHFGIKCGGDWTGPTFYKKDDDFNKRGKLVESCFRSYKNPSSSFLAHSEFLTDPKKHARYGFLFQLKSTDYKGWAHGLRKAGYATNPQYAFILIRIIEEMNLDQYDKVSISKSSGKAKENKVSNENTIVESSSRTTNFMFEEINNVRMVYARENSTPQTIAAITGTDVRQIMKYNEELKSGNQKLPANYPIYLQPKRNGYSGKEKYHVAGRDESLMDISQKYGIKVSSLSKRNKLPSNAILKEGERVKLKGLFKSKNTPRTESARLASNVSESNPTIHKAREVNAAHQVFHTVESEDTLFSLSRKYNIDIESIKILNNLTDNTIKLGQKLRIK